MECTTRHVGLYCPEINRDYDIEIYPNEAFWPLYPAFSGIHVHTSDTTCTCLVQGLVAMLQAT